MVVVVVAVTSEVSVHTIVIVGCLCGLLVVVLCVVLAVVCWRRRLLLKSTTRLPRPCVLVSVEFRTQPV